jgi:hypothetical protein
MGRHQFCRCLVIVVLVVVKHHPAPGKETRFLGWTISGGASPRLYTPLKRMYSVASMANNFSPISPTVSYTRFAQFMGYPPKALRTGFGAEGIATIDASGYGVFL